MDGVSGTNETAFGNSQGTAAQATNRPQSGHHRGRQVSESRESPAHPVRQGRETAGGGERAGENPGIRSRHATAVPSSTSRSGTTPTPHSGQEPEYGNVPKLTTPPVATSPASQEAGAPEQRTGHPLSRPLRPPSIALQPSAQPRRPVATPRPVSRSPDSPPLPDRTYANLGGATESWVEETYANMAAGVTGNPRQPSLPPTIPERTYLNVGTAARRRVEEISDDVAGAAGANRPRTPDSPPLPDRSYPNPGGATGPAVEEPYMDMAEGVIRKPQRSSLPPTVPEHAYLNVATAAEAEEEAIYDEIDAPQATSPQQPVQWRRRPVAQKMGGAAASDGLQPDQPLTSHRRDPVQAYQKLALAHLQAVRIEDPELELVRLYRRHVPEETPFDRQVRLDAQRHQEAAKKHAYLKAIFEIAAGNGELFDDLSRHVEVDEERQYLGGSIYRRYAAQARPFVGPTAADYLRSFDNQPEGVHKKVYRDALEAGLSHALGTAPAPLPVPDDATRL